MQDVFVRPVLFAVLNYATVAILDLAYFSLITVFLAVPIASGGLNFPPPLIGAVFASIGVVSCSAQVFLFPRVHKRLGSKRLLRYAICAFFIMFPMFALMHMAAIRWGERSVGVWAGIAILVFTNPVIDMGYSCSFIYVTDSSPSPALLGSVNGLAQTAVSFVRTLGPAGATSLFSISTSRNWMGGYAIYWILCILTMAALAGTSLLPETDTAVIGARVKRSGIE